MSPLLFTPLITYVALKARSVLAAAVMHGTLNGVAGAALIFLAGGTDLTQGLLGAAGFLTLALANVALLVYDRFFAAERLMTGRPLFPYEEEATRS